MLADGYVRHRGEPVCALVGDADAIAAITEADLGLTWQVLEPVELRCCAGRQRAATARPCGGQRALPWPRGLRRCRGGTGARCGAGGNPHRDRVRRARLYRAGSRLRAACRRPDRSGRLHAGPLHGSRRNRRHPGHRARAGAGDPDRDRRRLRRQARPVAAAADLHGGVAARSAGGDGLLAARKHGGQHQTPSGARAFGGGGRRGRTADRISLPRRLQYRRLCELGPDGGEQRASARDGAVFRA